MSRSKQARLGRLVGLCAVALLAGGLLGGCAGLGSDLPPFQPSHPDGWRRTDLEWENEFAASWRLVTPHDMQTPEAAGLKAETYFYAGDAGYTLESFYEASTGYEEQSCPGSQSTILDRSPSSYLYESTAPFESECWSYQLVRLEQGSKELHALIVYAHRPPSESDRQVWLQILSEAIFDPGP